MARSLCDRDDFCRAFLKHPSHENTFSTMDSATHDKKAKLASAGSGCATKVMEPLVAGLIEGPMP